MKTLQAIAFFLSISSGIAAAQVDPPTTYGRCMNNDIFTQANRNNANLVAQLRRAIEVTAPCNFELVKQEVAQYPLQFSPEEEQEMLQQLLTYVEQNRLDQQTGASSNSGGTTSLVSKGVGALVAVALESGSISRTTSGNVTTVTINSGQAANLLSAGQIKPCNIIESNCTFGRKVLSALTVTTSYNISQAKTSTNSTPSQSALTSLVGSNDPAFTGVSTRLDFHTRKSKINAPDLLIPFRDPSFQAAQEAYAKAYSALATAIVNDPDYQTTLQHALMDLQNTTANDTEDKVTTLLTELQHNIVRIISAKAADTVALRTFAASGTAFQGARDTAIATVLNKSTVSFEYDFDRLANQPDQSDFKFIYSYRTDPNRDKVLQMTANGGATLYDSLLGSATSRIRSSQAAFQLDYTATPSAAPVQAVVSGGYYFQYMSASGLLTLPSTQLAPGTAIPLPGNASELLNTTGPIHIGQGKITISRKGTNVSIPIALTFSNRTDLIKATKVGGNFGITYDFSSLFTRK